MRGQKAFTLVETLVTVAVVGILSSISVSNFQVYREKAIDIYTLNYHRRAIEVAEAFIADGQERYGQYCNTVVFMRNPSSIVINLPYFSKYVEQFMPSALNLKERIYMILWFGGNICPAEGPQVYNFAVPQITVAACGGSHFLHNGVKYPLTSPAWVQGNGGEAIPMKELCEQTS